MIIGKVFHTVNGEEKVIGEGIVGAGSHYAKDYPEQDIFLYQDSEDISEGKKYEHDQEKGIFFKEYQDNGEGFEEVYDSREGVDRSVDYPIPSWFGNAEPIPDYRSRYVDGEVESDFKGYIE